jgi:hypothetical protein
MFRHPNTKHKGLDKEGRNDKTKQTDKICHFLQLASAFFFSLFREEHRMIRETREEASFFRQQILTPTFWSCSHDLIRVYTKQTFPFPKFKAANSFLLRLITENFWMLSVSFQHWINTSRISDKSDFLNHKSFKSIEFPFFLLAVL